ncbi:ROK family protein [Paenibacillus cremeus]|uniref:ROK family protein n=1 Tax=Paenibacillus cremeus TaxID=2163881 RepID=UPI0021BD6F27|nr:ROK family protein [Paenibacillus cremeus]
MSGSLGGAGEIGHTTIVPDGPICPCGNHGCLQELSAGPAMEQQYRMLVRSSENSIMYYEPHINLQPLKATDVCAVAEEGDELAVQVVKQAASYLGISMANSSIRKPLFWAERFRSQVRCLSIPRPK